MLRILGLIVILTYTCVGLLLLASGQGGARIVGLILVSTGCAWLVIDALRRRRVI